MKMFLNLSKNEKAAARVLGVTAADLTFVKRTCYGDVYAVTDGRVYVDGVYLGYNRRDIYRSLLRKLLNRYGVVYESGPDAVNHLRAYIGGC